MDLVEKFLAAGADINGYGYYPTTGYSGKWATSLYNAVEKGNAAMAERLLAAKADPNIPSKDTDYCYPLHTAAALFQFNLVSTLLAAGANPKLGDEKCTAPLHFTISAGLRDRANDSGEVARLQERVEMMEILLSNGANIDTVGGKWGTALTTATTFNIIPIVEKLIAAGADLNLAGGESLIKRKKRSGLGPSITIENFTALQVAIGMGHRKIEDLLCAAGAAEPDVYLNDSEVYVLEVSTYGDGFGGIYYGGGSNHKHW